jgi:hypothetical protein
MEIASRLLQVGGAMSFQVKNSPSPSSKNGSNPHDVSADDRSAEKE